MPTINILALGVQGVDMLSNPLTLGPKKVASAVNGTFQEGVFRTRPGFDYSPLGIKGQFQGACAFTPSRGISAFSFAQEQSALIVAAGGKVWLTNTTDGRIACEPLDLSPDAAPFKGEVNLFAAENYLIVQNVNSDTHWWGGTGGLVASPGMAAETYWENPPI
jgi:hypothetical protein